MVTAKNLQLLDNQGNNISPAVNIETLYYEENRGGTIYRNHIFKHFPVFVKYNGQPGVKHEGGTFIGEDLHTQILAYERESWPEDASVRHVYVDNIPGSSDEVYWTTQSAPKDHTNTEGADIMVSGLTQSRLSKGNDFMRLDVSAYNLTQILEPYAYKNWVELGFEFLDTKLTNSIIYNSRYIMDPKRSDVQVRKDVGSLKAMTDVKTLNGKTYHDVLDKILFGPLPYITTPGKIKLSYTGEYRVEDSLLTNLSITSYLPQNIPASIGKNTTGINIKVSAGRENVPKYDCQNGKTGSLMKRIDMWPGSTTQDSLRIGNTNPQPVQLSIPSFFKNPTIKAVPIMTYKGIQLDNLELLCRNITDSTGVQVYANTTAMLNSVLMTYRTEVTRTKPVTKRKAEITEHYDAEMPMNMPGMSVVGNIDIYWPIKIGYGITTDSNKLTTRYIHGYKVHKIPATWDPVKAFYVCIPRIITCMLVNPFPKLSRVLQNGKWMTSSNWIIKQVIVPVPDAVNKICPELAAYTVYKIQPMGLGSAKHIEIAINTTKSNKIPD